MLVTFSTGSPREEEANQGLPVEEAGRAYWGGPAVSAMLLTER